LFSIPSEAPKKKKSMKNYVSMWLKNKKTNFISIKKAQKKQLVTRLFEQI
jgi:hypothetical protein